MGLKLLTGESVDENLKAIIVHNILILSCDILVVFQNNIFFLISPEIFLILILTTQHRE